MNLLKRPISTFFFTLISLYIIGQNHLTINLAPIGEIESSVTEFPNHVLITVVNNFATEIDVYFRVSIVGSTTDGRMINIDNANSASGDIVNIPTAGLNITLEDLINQYQNTQLSDYNISPTDFINEIQTYGHLPAGNYNICIEAYDLNNVLVSVPTATPDGNNCLIFEIIHYNPPIIQSPINNTWVGANEDNQVLITWAHDYLGSSVTYRVEIIRFPSHQAANDFMIQGNSQELFGDAMGGGAYERILTQDDIRGWNFNTLSADVVPNITPGDVLAVRVTAISENITFLNEGRSDIHVFIYGVPNPVLCDNPSLNVDWAFPSVGDTLPFTDLFAVARFQPSCDNILEMNADIRFIRSYNGSVVGSTTVRNYRDNWRSGPGPANYLRNYFTRHYPSDVDFFYPIDSEYEQYLPFLHNTAITFHVDRGEQLNIFGATTFTIKELPSNIERTQTINLNAMSSNGVIIGMPRPELKSPAHDAVMRPGTIQFDFNTGLEPGNPLPPFKIFKLEGYRYPIIPGLLVKEKCVLQVARDNSFSPTSIVFCKLKKIQGNPYNNNDNFNEDNPNFESISNTFDLTPHRQFDHDHFSQQVYKDLSVSHDFTAEDTLYWRVIWLRFPDAYNMPSPCGSGIDITPSDYYHASPIRRLIISNDGPETPIAVEDVPPPPPSSGSLDCERICNTPEIPEAQKVAVSGISIGDIVRIGDYSFVVSTITGSSEYSGTGVLRLNNNIQLNVNFSGARINAARQMFAGTVTAQSENRSDLPRTNRAEMAAIVDGISELRRLSEALSGAPTTLPLGIDFTADTELRMVAALDKATFTPTGARASYLIGVKLPEEMDGLSLLFAADELCLNPNGSAGAGIYQLAANLDATLDNGWAIGISGGRDTATTTYVEFDCEGFKALAFRGRIVFSRDALVPENVTTGDLEAGQVAAVFGAKVDRNAKFIIGITFDKPFQFTELPQVGFTVTNAILDFSESENYPGMRFPTLYDINRLPPLPESSTPSPLSPEIRLRNSWTGFYLRELSLRLPKDLAASRPGIGIGDVLIDPTGVSFEVRNTGVWSTAQESEHGYSLSLDTLAIGLVQSTTGYGRISGGIGLPIFEEGDLLNYSAVLSFGATPPASGESTSSGSDVNFLFRIKPDATGIKIPMWDIARITLAPTTRVDLAIGSAFEFSFSITGDVSFTSSNRDRPARDGEMSINFPSIRVENLAFSTARSGIRGRILLQNNGTNTQLWAQASPQKDVSGFPINLDGISILPVSGSLTRYDLRFDLKVHFGDKISGGADLGFRFNLGREGSPDFSRFTFEEFLAPTSIEIEANDMGGLDLYGRISFCNSGPNERFIGELRVGIPSIGQINLYADFGTQRNNPNAEFNTADNFSFFAIEGSVILSTGITLFPGVALYGIGGGVFYHMRRTGPLPTLTAPPVSEIAGATPASSDRSTLPPATPIGCASAPFEPHFLTFIGFGFKAYLGDNGGGSAYNFDIGIEATIAANPDGSVRGLQRVVFDGNLYVSCGIGRGNDTAPLRARVNIAWTKGVDGDDNYEGIHGIIQVYLNVYNVVRGAGAGNKLVDAVFHADNRGLWYFYLGAPEGTQSRTFPSPGAMTGAVSNYPEAAGISALGLTLSTYFMIGMGIPDLPPPNPLIEAILARAEGDAQQDRVEEKITTLPRAVNPTEMEVGDGFAHGLSFSMNSTFNFLLFYAKLNLVLGYDINLRQYTGRNCRIISGTGEGAISEERPLGINGWYAKGQAYAGIQGELGIGVDFTFFTAKIPIIELGCAIAISAEFPSPEHFKGRAGLYYDILNGAVTGRCNFVFEVGSKCYDPNYSPLDGLKFITDLKPEGNQVSVYTKAEAAFAFSMDRILPLKDEQYEGEGELIRYFRPEFKRFLITKVSDGSIVEFRPHTLNNNGYYAYSRAVSALSANTDYVIRAEVIVYERIDGRWIQVRNRDGSFFVDFMEKNFTTGPQPTTLIPENIVATYPIQKQRNFMLGEMSEKGGNMGWLTLDVEDPILLEPSGPRNQTIYEKAIGAVTISYKIYIKSAETNDNPIIVDAMRMNAKFLTWQMPTGLLLGRRYELKIVKQITNTRTGNIDFAPKQTFQTIRRYFQIADIASSTANIRLSKLEKSTNDPPNITEVVLLKYFFRTSQFNTLREKVDASAFIAASRNLLIPSINFTLIEPFDEFDKNGYVSTATGTLVIGPLVVIKENYSSPILFNRLKYNVYTFGKDLKYTRWIHKFTPKDGISFLPIFMNDIRSTRLPYWVLPERHSVDIIYNDIRNWVDEPLPQLINLGTVAPPLRSHECISFSDLTSSDPINSINQPSGYNQNAGVGSRVGDLSGSVVTYTGSPSFTVYSANEFAWNTHAREIKNKSQSIISRMNRVLAVSRVNEFTNVVHIGEWFATRNGPPSMTFTALSNNAIGPVNYNYLIGQDYTLDWYYQRPKESMKKKTSKNWRL